METIRLGDRFYRFIDNKEDQLELLRVIKMKNENKFTCVNMETNETVSITRSDLREGKYTKLIPDGLIAFCIVDLQQGTDVIVMNYLMDDLVRRDSLPYSVCRQNVYDLFTNNLPKKSKEDIYVGMSVNRDNIPDGTPFEIMLACENIKRTVNIDVYIDDTLDDMLSLIDTTPFDQVLQSNKQHVLPCAKGYCSSLEELLKQCNFMYDFYKGYNIIQVPFKVQIAKDTRQLMPRQRSYLESQTGIPMLQNMIAEYTKLFDPDEFKDIKYMLIGDKEERVYVLVYDEGNYLSEAEFEARMNMRDSLAAINYINNK